LLGIVPGKVQHYSHAEQQRSREHRGFSAPLLLCVRLPADPDFTLIAAIKNQRLGQGCRMIDLSGYRTAKASSFHRPPNMPEA
jgi:hypothetical protein